MSFPAPTPQILIMPATDVRSSIKYFLPFLFLILVLKVKVYNKTFSDLMKQNLFCRYPTSIHRKTEHSAKFHISLPFLRLSRRRMDDTGQMVDWYYKQEKWQMETIHLKQIFVTYMKKSGQSLKIRKNANDQFNIRKSISRLYSRKFK